MASKPLAKVLRSDSVASMGTARIKSVVRRSCSENVSVLRAWSGQVGLIGWRTALPFSSVKETTKTSFSGGTICDTVRPAARDRDSEEAEVSEMSIRALKPFIPSGPDFSAAKAFFRDLGFAVNWEADGLAELQLGGATFLLQDFHNQEMQSNLMMFVSVENLDDWWRHVLDSGVVGRYPGVKAREPADYPWGRREAHLIDPAGVCWHFA